MSISVTRGGVGPALVRAGRTPHAERRSRGMTLLWIALALVVALIVAMPAFAQAAPPVGAPGAAHQSGLGLLGTHAGKGTAHRRHPWEALGRGCRRDGRWGMPPVR